MPELPSLDRVIHAPARLKIVALLYGLKEADFLYLLHQSKLTKGNLSTHLYKLEDANYIEIEKTYQGKIPLTLCRLTESGRKAFEEYREQLNRLMAFTEPPDKE